MSACAAPVVQAGRLELTGRLAWVVWGLLHLAYLPGSLNPMTTGLKYLRWHVSHENANRVLVAPPDLADTAAEPATPRSATAADELERT